MDEELKKFIESTAAETRRHFDVATEGVRHEVRLLAERIVLVDEKVSQSLSDMRDEARAGFADTQAMIKFSHAELDSASSNAGRRRGGPAGARRATGNLDSLTPRRRLLR